MSDLMPVPQQEARLAELARIGQRRPLTAAEKSERTDLEKRQDARFRVQRTRITDQIATTRARLARLLARADQLGVTIPGGQHG